MKRLTARWALCLCVLAATSAAPASASPTRSLNDAHLGNARVELEAQIQHSTDVIEFFTVGQGRWMIHRRHDTCNDVLGEPKRLCTHSRAVLQGHLWLKDEATQRFDRLYPPPFLPSPFWRCVASGEGSPTTDTGNGFFGMYQMDWGFMHNHGADMLVKYHGLPASSWSVEDQTIVAERGYTGSVGDAQGSGAWPHTAPQCVYLR